MAWHCMLVPTADGFVTSNHNRRDADAMSLSSFQSASPLDKYGFLTETVVAGLQRIFEPLSVIRCHIPDFRGGCSAASISRSKEY
jgi:hypothetical protein